MVKTYNRGSIMKLIAILCSPFYFLGFFLGFILRPFNNGWLEGFYHFEIKEIARQKAKTLEIMANKGLPTNSEKTE